MKHLLELESFDLNEASKSIDVENENKLQAQLQDKIKEAKLKMSKVEASNKKQFEKTLEKSKLTSTIAKLTAALAASMNKEALALQGLSKEQQNSTVA